MLLAAPAHLILFSIAGLWVALWLPGYEVVGEMPRDAPSTPLAKEVVREPGAWMNNFIRYPWMITAPVLAYVGVVGAWALAWARRPLLAFVFSSACIFGAISTAGLAMFPFLIPSITDPNSSLTVWDASSSQLTLYIMLLASVVVLPIAAWYTTFVYRVLRGKVTAADIEERGPSLY